MRYSLKYLFRRSGLPDFRVRKYLSFTEGRRMNLATFYKALPERGGAYNTYDDIPIGKVIELRNLPNSWTIMEFIEAYRILTDLSYKRILKKNITELFMFSNFAISALQYYAEKEKALESKPDAKQIKAGIEELYKFGDLTTLKEVADYCNITLEQAESVRWGLAFSVIYYNNSYAKFNKRYMNIITKDGHS
jgi:hypothetical protein